MTQCELSRESSPKRSKQSHNPQQQYRLGEQLSFSRINSVYSCNTSKIKVPKKKEMKLDRMLDSSPNQSSVSHASSISDGLKILYEKIQLCIKSVKKTVTLLNQQRDISFFQPIKRYPSISIDISMSSGSHRNIISDPNPEKEATFSNQSSFSINQSLEYLIDEMGQALNYLQEKKVNRSNLKLRNDQLEGQNQLLTKEKQQLGIQYHQLLKQYQQLLGDNQRLKHTLNGLKQQYLQNENALNRRIKQMQKEIQQTKLQFYTLSEMSKKFTPTKKQSQSPRNLVSSIALKPLLALQYLPQKSEQEQSESNDRRLPRQAYHSTDSKSILPSDSSKLSILPYINPQLQYLKKRSSPYMKGTNTNYRITSRQNAHARSRVWNRLDTSKL